MTSLADIQKQALCLEDISKVIRSKIDNLSYIDLTPNIIEEALLYYPANDVIDHIKDIKLRLKYRQAYN